MMQSLEPRRKLHMWTRYIITKHDRSCKNDKLLVMMILKSYETAVVDFLMVIKSFALKPALHHVHFKCSGKQLHFYIFITSGHKKVAATSLKIKLGLETVSSARYKRIV